MSKAAALDMRAADPHRHIRAFGVLSRLVVLGGRACFSAIFLMAVPNHFSQQAVAYAAQNGVPMPGVLVPASGVLAGLGAASVLLGYKARLGGWLLVAFLVPVTFMMHNFWAVSDPMQAGCSRGCS